jgi:hypothetical protein
MTKAYPLETKLGKINIHTNSATEVVVTFDDLLVNQISRGGNMRLALVAGKWDLLKSNATGLSGYNSLHINSIWDGKKDVPASDAARKKVRTVITEAVQDFFDQHPEHLKVADADRLAGFIQRKETEVADLRVKLKNAVGELEYLQRLRTQNFQPEELDNILRVMEH